MTPEELIAEQDATITELRAEIERLEGAPDYWERASGPRGTLGPLPS